MKIQRQVLRLVLSVVLLINFAEAQTLPAGVERRASMAGITEYAYPNGLRVLLLPDAGSATITVNMIYLVGSRHEGYGETGMAHLLEHMNFILTTDGRNIKQELTNRGADFNGTTSYDRTNYFETVKATDDNLKWALSLEADRMVKMRIEKQLLDTEMTVVRNEFERGENNIGRVLGERVLSTAFCGTTTANPPSARGRISNASQSTGLRRSTESIISRTTPCWWSPAPSIPQRRSP
jgi:zinc protease